MACSEHSGMVARMDAVEKRTEKADERFYHILISTILTLITTLATGATVVYSTVSAKVDRMHAAQQKTAIVRTLEEFQELKRKTLLTQAGKNGQPIIATGSKRCKESIQE